jgi:energy-coupling factor transporter ATP-binding protein EcfA2
MNDLYLDSIGKRIKLSIDGNFDLDKLLMQQYIPSLNISDSTERVDYELQVLKGNPAFDYDQRRAIYTVPNIDNNDVMALFSRYFEYLFFKDRKYSVHSSAFCRDDETTIIAGRSGAGKTTLLLKLLEEDSGLEVISGDRTLIDGDYALGGTRVINVKGSSLLYEFPELGRRMGIEEDTGAQEQFRLTECNSPFKYRTKPAIIKNIIYPFKTSGELEVKQLGHPSRLTRFVNQAFHFLDEFPRILLGGQMVLSTPITEDEKNIALIQMNSLISGVDSYAISGSLEDMQKWIAETLLE